MTFAQGLVIKTDVETIKARTLVYEKLRCLHKEKVLKQEVARRRVLDEEEERLRKLMSKTLERRSK